MYVVKNAGLILVVPGVPIIKHPLNLLGTLILPQYVVVPIAKTRVWSGLRKMSTKGTFKVKDILG